jgi:hypothetical protein
MKAKTMDELIAAHRAELAALTQQIGELNAVINLRDELRLDDADLLYEAKRQIIALNSELNNALGVEPTCNVVALMIEDRLKDRLKNRELPL